MNKENFEDEKSVELCIKISINGVDVKFYDLVGLNSECNSLLSKLDKVIESDEMSGLVNNE